MAEHSTAVEEAPPVPRAYPLWLFSQEQGAVLVENAEQEATMTGTWHNSPADYGLETAPSGNPTVSMPLGTGAAAVPTDARLEAALASVSNLEAAVADVLRRVQQLDAQHTHILSMMAAGPAPAPAQPVELPVQPDAPETARRR